jgi:hypothetical protein
MIATWLVQLIIRALGPNLLIDSYVTRKIIYGQASERLYSQHKALLVQN